MAGVSGSVPPQTPRAHVRQAHRQRVLRVARVAMHRRSHVAVRPPVAGNQAPPVDPHRRVRGVPRPQVAVHRPRTRVVHDLGRDRGRDLRARHDPDHGADAAFIGVGRSEADPIVGLGARSGLQCERPARGGGGHDSGIGERAVVARRLENDALSGDAGLGQRHRELHHRHRQRERAEQTQCALPQADRPLRTQAHTPHPLLLRDLNDRGFERGRTAGSRPP